MLKGQTTTGLPRPVLAILLLSCGATACNSSGAMETQQYGAPRSPDEFVPERVAVSGGPVTVGVSLGRLRAIRTVPAFEISRYPITTAEYQQCVAAKVCGAPSLGSTACRLGTVGLDQATLGSAAPDNAPVTCAKDSDARTYCAWVGGRLPTIDEWLLAARGKDVHRWVWGDEDPDCEHNFRVDFDPNQNRSCCGKACDSMDVIGASLAAGLPHGTKIERALSTQGEMVAPSTQDRTLGCLTTSSACYVSGIRPGAVDFISRGEDFNAIASFRCAWGGQS